MITFTFKNKPLSILGDTFIYDGDGYYFTEAGYLSFLDFSAKHDCSREEKELILSIYESNKRNFPNEEKQFPQNANNLTEDEVCLYLYGSQNDDLLIYLLKSYVNEKYPKGKYLLSVRLDKFIKMRPTLSSRVLDEIIFNDFSVVLKTAIVDFELEEKHYDALLMGEDADIIKIALRQHINSFNSNRFEKLLATEDIAYDRMVLFSIPDLPQYIREALCVRYNAFLDKITKDYLKENLPRSDIKNLAPLVAFVPIIERLNTVYHY